MLQKQQKRRLLKHDKAFKIKQFTNVIIKIDVDNLKINEQIKLKPGKKIKNSHFDSKFTGSLYKKYNLSKSLITTLQNFFYFFGWFYEQYSTRRDVY